jgi:hypothetical protein
MADEITALLQVTSGDIGRDRTAPVVLRWESVGEAVAYRLFRREDGQPADSAVEINGRTPVRLPQSAAELHEIVSPDSPEWETLARTLTAARPGAGPDDGQQLVDPDEVFDRGLTDTEARFVQAGAQASLTMGRVAGLAFVDTRQPDGASLQYELRGIRRDGSELILATAVPVIVGVSALPAYPSGLIVQPGDRRVLVLWNRNVQGAATYMVERAMGPGGPFTRINPQPIAYDMTEGIDGTALPFPQPGFLDAGAWDSVTGDPIPHLVQAAWVSGPDTGWTYWYRVAARDTLDRWGPWSPPVAATPVRSLPPMAPDELVVLPTTTADGLTVQWRTVYRNVENHRLVNKTLPDPLQKTYVYRAETREELEDIAGLPAHLVTTRTIDPRPGTAAVQSWVDTDPVLVPPYGTKPFFYRLRVEDAFGFVSAPSAIVSGTVPDTTPPGPTDIVSATGDADHIRIEWKPNPEPDVGGYQIYRGVCDHGHVFVPGIIRDANGEIVGEQEGRDKSRFRCDMQLVGDVSVGAANAMLEVQGAIRFDDFSVPAGSPICYAYWVRAYDHSGNLYAGDGRACPREGEYACAALREKTPPRAPVLTALRARNHAVELEWVGAPEQDLHAFHVYRSEKESDPGHFIACVFTDGSTQPVPWTGLVPSCAAVPAVADPLAARGSYTDTEAEPHKIFWYRVSAVDWLGNESEAASLERLPASSTFSYSSDRPAVPSIHPGGVSAADVCGLGVEWDPPFDVNTQRGFVVFRATAGKPYRQVSGVVTGNGFLDETARRGVDYLYCVQAIDLEGYLSEPSAPSTRRY